MPTNKKNKFIKLTADQQMISRKLRSDYESKTEDLKEKVLELKTSIMFLSNYENLNQKKESQLINELNKSYKILKTLHAKYRNKVRSILTEDQKIIFDTQKISIKNN